MGSSAPSINPRRAGATACLAMVAMLALLPGAAAAKRPPPEPCAPGIFTLGAPLVIDGEVTSAATRVSFTGTAIALPDLCPEPAPAVVKTRKSGTVVTAAWLTCGGFPGPVRFSAKIGGQGCARMKGRLLLKKAKPRKRAFSATRAPGAAAMEALRDVETHLRLLNESFPFLLRPAAEAYTPEVSELIALGSAVVPAILDEFRRPAALVDDTPLSLLAYVLERIGDSAAVPVLTAWLDEHLFAELIWAPDFVTHAIKVLIGQGDLDATTYVYGVEAKLDTILQARVSAPATASSPLVASFGAARLPMTAIPGTNSSTGGVAFAAASGAEAAGDCHFQIHVTGINAAGQQDTVTIDYRVASRDIEDIIGAQTNSREQARYQKIQQGWRESDEEAYGSSDYQPLAGADVSQRSNCAGTVTEHIVNALAAAKGLPVQLGQGQGNADAIRGLALAFGGEVGLADLDPFTVISHDTSAGPSAHVEVPVAADAAAALVYSKDNYGRLRQHTVGKTILSSNGFGPAQRHYNQRPWYLPGSSITTRFYRVDPSRILGVVVDSGACPCMPGAPGTIPVAITEPSAAETDARVVTIAGTIDEPAASGGTLRLNGAPQPLAVSGGAFATTAVLRSGDNTVRVTVDAPDGRRGCAERMVRSTTPRTSLSATLTWSVNDTDLDLYLTQPDGVTAWYSRPSTSIGGRLDVDDTNGFGPENYFLSSEEGDTVLPGAYTLRVHYFSDHQADEETPPRVVSWRVDLLINEGTPAEQRKVTSGVLSMPSPGNAQPGGSGPDWAAVDVVTLAPPP